MSRSFDRSAFERLYDELIVHGHFTEEPVYYPRYISRYRNLLRLYARVAPPPPIDFLDIGGGIFATLVVALWGDRAVSADLGGRNYDYLRAHGVEPVEWNLCGEAQPLVSRFDAVMFSEVIEHLPIPGHVVLGRLRKALRPGGILICSTPNFYRLRNIVYVALGRRIYDNFDIPTDRGLGHVIEYDRDRLAWQVERAGLSIESLDLCCFTHNPKSVPFRVLSWLGYPLNIVPRFREHLVVVARAPAAGI